MPRRHRIARARARALDRMIEADHSPRGQGLGGPGRDADSSSPACSRTAAADRGPNRQARGLIVRWTAAADSTPARCAKRRAELGPTIRALQEGRGMGRALLDAVRDAASRQVHAGSGSYATTTTWCTRAFQRWACRSSPSTVTRLPRHAVTSSRLDPGARNARNTDGPRARAGAPPGPRGVSESSSNNLLGGSRSGR